MDFLPALFSGLTQNDYAFFIPLAGVAAWVMLYFAGRLALLERRGEKIDLGDAAKQDAIDQLVPDGFFSVRREYYERRLLHGAAEDKIILYDLKEPYLFNKDQFNRGLALDDNADMRTGVTLYIVRIRDGIADTKATGFIENGYFNNHFVTFDPETKSAKLTIDLNVNLPADNDGGTKRGKLALDFIVVFGRGEITIGLTAASYTARTGHSLAAWKYHGELLKAERPFSEISRLAAAVRQRLGTDDFSPSSS